jgi:hypothetical protein
MENMTCELKSGCGIGKKESWQEFGEGALAEPLAYEHESACVSTVGGDHQLVKDWTGTRSECNGPYCFKVSGLCSEGSRELLKGFMTTWGRVAVV